MNRKIIASLFLVLAILFIALGINGSNSIIAMIGGFCAGIYNSMIYDTRS